jgi:hypothetical protein
VLLIVVVLVLQTNSRKADVQAAEDTAFQLKRRVDMVNNVHGQAAAIIDENEVARALVSYLQQRARPLNGLVRTQRAMMAHLPPQAWIEKLEVSMGSTRSQQAAPRVTLAAAAKELNGADPTRVLLDFHKALTKDVEAAGDAKASMKQGDDRDGARRVIITVTLGEEQ